VTQPLICYCTRTSVIEEGDRISARFTYNGTFSKAFMGYQPNGTAAQMRSSDIRRVKDGKLIEHWDELNLLEVFQQIRRGDG
jgi:predicted ester cyclase